MPLNKDIRKDFLSHSSFWLVMYVFQVSTTLDKMENMAGVDQFGGGDYAVASATAEIAGINEGMGTIGAEAAQEEKPTKE